VFLGRFDHSLDEKGRLAIPARFRAELENGLYLTAGLERCLHVLTPQAFQSTADALNSLSWLNPGAAELQRNLFGMTTYLTPDKLGRILVPPSLRE
jgi:MraZ protein